MALRRFHFLNPMIHSQSHTLKGWPGHRLVKIGLATRPSIAKWQFQNSFLFFLGVWVKLVALIIPPRILDSACPGQELHKCLAWQCLATTVWNIVKHAGMSSARLFLFCYFVHLLYFCIWTAVIIWSKPQRHFGISCLRFSWVQRSNSFRTLSLPSTQNPTLLARAVDNLIQLAVFHQFAALGSLDRTGK